MANLFMVTGLGSARDLASGKKGAFYNTLEEFHQYWDRVDVISPKITNYPPSPNGFGRAGKLQITNQSQPSTLNHEPRLPVRSRSAKAGTSNSESRTINLFGNVFVHVSPLPLILHPFYFVWKAVSLNKSLHFNLMTVHEFPPFYNGIGARIIHRLTGVPYILEVMHIPGLPKARALKEKIYRRLAKAFISFDARPARAVRVINKSETPDFLKKAGVPAEKILYISAFYLDLDVFKSLGLSKEYDLIFVGRLEQNKGLDLLLEAIRLLVTNHKLSVKCLIVGSGPLLNHLKLEIRNLKLQDNVLLHGWAKDVREIAGLINKSKILVMPSYNEGGPRVVLEAMACGVPVLATPVGAVPDVIKNREFGITIDWDAGDIAKKAAELLTNEPLYRRMVANGLEAAKRFEKKSAIRNYADELKNIIQIHE